VTYGFAAFSKRVLTSCVLTSCANQPFLQGLAERDSTSLLSLCAALPSCVNADTSWLGADAGRQGFCHGLQLMRFMRCTAPYGRGPTNLPADFYSTVNGRHTSAAAIVQYTWSSPLPLIYYTS
jgi:hypothetical protein